MGTLAPRDSRAGWQVGLQVPFCSWDKGQSQVKPKCFCLQIHALNPGHVASLIPRRGREEGEQVGRRLETSTCRVKGDPGMEPMRRREATGTSLREGMQGRMPSGLGWRWVRSGASGSKCPVVQGFGNSPGTPSMSHKHHLGGRFHDLHIPLLDSGPSLSQAVLFHI